MRVHLINPSEVSFGTAVITPRWLYVLAAATPSCFGNPSLVDETLEAADLEQIQAGDIVGIGIHTANALRGYKIGKIARDRGAYVVFGGIHATLYPTEAHELGGAHAVVKGDGDVVWSRVLSDCSRGTPLSVYEGGRIEADRFLPARWDLVPRKNYMWASVQTVRGCPKHCSFCSVWRTGIPATITGAASICFSHRMKSTVPGYGVSVTNWANAISALTAARAVASKVAGRSLGRPKMNEPRM